MYEIHVLRGPGENCWQRWRELWKQAHAVPILIDRAARPTGRKPGSTRRLPRDPMSKAGAAMVHTIPVGFIPLADAFAQAVSELADFTQSALDERGSDTEHDYFNRRDKIVRQIEKSMRNALADRDLSVFVDTPDGPRELVEREEWRELSFGIPNIENVSHHLTSPGPDSNGHPTFLKTSDFQDWLTKQNKNNPGAVRLPKKIRELDSALYPKMFDLLNRGEATSIAQAAIQVAPRQKIEAERSKALLNDWRVDIRAKNSVLTNPARSRQIPRALATNALTHEHARTRPMYEAESGICRTYRIRSSTTQMAPFVLRNFATALA